MYTQKDQLYIHIKKFHPVNVIKIKTSVYTNQVAAQRKLLHTTLVKHFTSPREDIRKETKEQILNLINNPKPSPITHNQKPKISEKILDIQDKLKLLSPRTSSKRSKSTPKYRN
jgi:hypothetical protein